MVDSPPPPYDAISPTATRSPGRPGIGFADVEKAADALLREGTRPTLERIRTRIGRGSPNTIQPLLDRWWKSLSARLDAGPAALHRIPESVVHVVEALWLRLLAEARIRADQERSSEAAAQSADRQTLEVRSYVLSLREGELEERLRQREDELARLRQEVSALSMLLRKSQALQSHRDRERRRAAPSRSDGKHTRTRMTGSRPKLSSNRKPRTTARPAVSAPRAYASTRTAIKRAVRKRRR